jgi:hypothetical protein
VHPHTSHHRAFLTPRHAPPPFAFASPQTPHLAPPPFPAHPALKTHKARLAARAPRETCELGLIDSGSNWHLRPCLYTTRQWLRETNKPSAATLNPPTSPTARPATPTFDDYVPSSAHNDVRFAPTPSAPPPPPFTTLDMHPHRSHLASPQTPHLAPPAPPALKRTRPDSPPPASHPPHYLSPEPQEAHDHGDEPWAAGTSTQLPTQKKNTHDLNRATGPPSSRVKLILSPKQRAKPAASRTKTCANAARCIASGECPSRF